MAERVAPHRRRRSVIHCYLTADQKAAADRLARAVGLSASELLRLLLVTADPGRVRRLRRHPAYLAATAKTSP